MEGYATMNNNQFVTEGALRPIGILCRLSHIRSALVNAGQHILGLHRAGEHGSQVLADIHPLRVDVVYCRLVNRTTLVLVSVHKSLQLGRKLALHAREWK